MRAVRRRARHLQRRTVYRPGVFYFGLVHAFLLLTAFALGTLALDSTYPWLAVIPGMFEVAVLARAPSVGVSVQDGDLVHRDWFLTTRYAVATIECVTLSRYRGFLQPNYQSVPMEALLLSFNSGESIRLESTARTPRAAQLALDQLCNRYGIAQCDPQSVHDPD